LWPRWQQRFEFHHSAARLFVSGYRVSGFGMIGYVKFLTRPRLGSGRNRPEMRRDHFFHRRFIEIADGDHGHQIRADTNRYKTA
jgi:hypothetical protein